MQFLRRRSSVEKCNWLCREYDEEVFTVDMRHIADPEIGEKADESCGKPL